jgi:hypothetical protein
MEDFFNQSSALQGESRKEKPMDLAKRERIDLDLAWPRAAKITLM